jgi:hypothetical protein
MYWYTKSHKRLEPISYRGALLSTLLHATVYLFLDNLLNVLVHQKPQEALNLLVTEERY